MTDFKGTEINVGDKVAVALCSGTQATFLAEGIVKGFCKRGGYNCVKIEIPNYYGYTRIITRAKHKVVKI